jgi:hypothetical protein
MGGFNPIKTAIGAATTLAGVNSDYNRTAGNYDNARKQYELQTRKINADEQADLERADAASGETERQRRDTLRRATARQNAQFGSMGIDTRDGSGESVLLGLFSQSDAQRGYQQRLDKIKRDAIVRDADYARRRSLLDLEGMRRSTIAGTASSATSLAKNLLL